MAWAMDQELSCIKKMVLVTLANYLNAVTGQCNPSIDRLAKVCGLSSTSTRAAVKDLEISGFIEITRERFGKVNISNKYRLLFGTSQSEVGTSQSEVGVPRHVMTKQEVKQEFKTTPLPPLKGGIVSPTQKIPDWLDAEVWDSFVKFRKEIKAPLSVHAAELALRKLERLRKEGHDPTQVIEQSILSGWKGLFSADDRRALNVEQWWRSNAGIDAKGREIGLNARGGENYENYKTRIFEELKVRT